MHKKEFSNQEKISGYCHYLIIAKIAIYLILISVKMMITIVIYRVASHRGIFNSRKIFLAS